MSGHAASSTLAELQLADWRRCVSTLYAEVRASEPAPAWDLWRATRERLFLEHPQSPLPAEQRTAAHAPAYFPYDPAWRRTGVVREAPRERLTLSDSGAGAVEAERVAFVEVEGLPRLSLFWLREYSGGLFLSFRDAGSGASTYGGGRYLLDTAKGADLGGDGATLMLDFNFSYQPSCSYDPRWSCPLPPRENWLEIAVAAGERLRI